MSPRHTTAALIALVAGACTQADLVPLERPELYERQSLRAEVCAPAQATEQVPYKILFVIDTSFSNSWNDPDGRREQAVRLAISSLLPMETVSFGIITFADEPRRQTYGFTRDLQVLNGATANVSNAEGRTNYSDSLWAVIDFIQDDVDTLSSSEAARSHYLVYWLSDGYPTVGVTDPPALLPAIDYLQGQLAHRVAELRFNTAYLGTSPDVDQYSRAEEEAAVNLLGDLARLGGGEFTSIPSGESFAFDIDMQPVLSRYQFAYAIASNRHLRLGPDGQPGADSDGDGLSDVFERQQGLDPTRADSDGDGYGDGIEWLISSGLDPLSPDPGCKIDEADSDGDGLLDCEEIVAGTLINNPDSDGDQLLDRDELLLGTSAGEDDARADDDMDGLLNQEELRFHLDPRRANEPGEREEWSYRYKVTALPVSGPNQANCYQLEVDNLTMIETLEGAGHPRGGNLIDVIIGFKGNQRTRTFRAQLRGRVLRDADLWDPADGRFRLAAEDFVEF